MGVVFGNDPHEIVAVIKRSVKTKATTMKTSMIPKFLRVIEDKKSRFFHFRFPGPDGKVVQVSSGCTDLQSAMNVAANCDLLVMAMKEKLLVGRQFLVTLRLIYQMICGRKLPVTAVEDYCIEWLEGVKSLKGQSTSDNQDRAISLFLEHLGGEGLLMDEVRPRHIKSFVVFLETKKDHKPGSINARLDVLSAMFNDAVRDDVLEKNPAKGISAPDRETDTVEDDLNRQPFKLVHIRSMIDKGLVAGLNPELTIATILNLDPGARVGDAFGFQRSFYKRESGEFRYYIRKIKKWHTIILFPATQALLNEYLDHHVVNTEPSAPFYPSFHVPSGPKVTNDDYLNATTSVSNYYAKYLVAIGLRPAEADEDPDRVGRMMYDYSYHCGRATANTAQKQIGIPTAIVMARLAHASKEANKKYDRFNVANVCRHVFEGAGLETALSPKVLDASSITMKEIFAEMDYARQKLVELRGKLELQNGDTIPYRAKGLRASLLPLGSNEPVEGEPTDN